MRIVQATIASAMLCAALANCDDVQRVAGYPDRYAGVGLELTIEGDRPKVVRPLKGGPSEAAGIKSGDIITAINGQPTVGMTLGGVVTKLRGRPNTQLTLALERKDKRILVVMRRRKMTKTGKKVYEAEGK